MSYPAEIALGQTVWSNHRWGKVIGIAGDAFMIQFRKEANPETSNREPAHSDKAAEFERLFGFSF